MACDQRVASFSALNARANQLAWYLRAQGVRPEGRVAVCLDRGLELIVGLLATLKAGGTYVPLDPAYPMDRLRFILADSAAAVVLTQERYAGLFADAGGGMRVLDMLEASPPWRDQPSRDASRSGVGLTPQHAAYVIYTSGSTGTPKGVAVPHGGVSALIEWHRDALGLTREDRVLQFLAPGFDWSISEMMVPLAAGASLLFVKSRALTDAATAISRRGISVLHSPPSVLQAMVTLGGSLDSLRIVCVGGEKSEWSTIDAIRSVAPRCRLINMYGPTEASIVAVAGAVETDGADRARPVSIGRPVANTTSYVLDVGGNPCPAGVAGELYLGGDGVARGYVGRPALTAERFVPDPFDSTFGRRLYRTGDSARWRADGRLDYLGRRDSQVKIRGFRIELEEIDARLMEHEGVREAVVIVREDAGAANPLVAYYTCNRTPGGEPVGPEGLRAHLVARVPEYMVPAAYVRLPQLPLTPNGKLDRHALPAPRADAYAAAGHEAPIGTAETTIAAVWREVLRVERVGRHDNFFELGGHSLMAATLLDRLRRHGVHVDVRRLFLTPTIADLAAAAELAESASAAAPNRFAASGDGHAANRSETPSPLAATVTPPLRPLVQLTASQIARIVDSVAGGAANVQDIYPLAPLQAGILFHHVTAGERDPYVLAVRLRFSSRSRLDAYLAAMQTVIDRHDILRTAVMWEGLPEPVQVVWRHAALPVEEVPIDPAAGDVARQLGARVDAHGYRLTVRHAPLMRAFVAEDRDHDRWVMTLLRHHLAGDHSTLEVIEEEIEAVLIGEADRLPPPIPFRNFVARAHTDVSSEEREAYFRELLGDVDEPTAPFGLLDVQREWAGIEEAQLDLDASLARRARDCARTLGVSAATLCHVAWAQVLARTANRDDVVFGTVLLGRMHAGAGGDRALGVYMNTLPARIRVGGIRADVAVRRTHRLLADLLRHEHAPLALAQRCSGVPPPTPLFTTLLNYRHTADASQRRSVESRRAWDGIQHVQEEERTNYPITLNVDDLGEGFRLTAQVDASIGAMRICRYMEVALASLLDTLQTDPGRPLRLLDVLPEAERQRVLREWNDTAAAYPKDTCIQEWFEAQTRKTPDAVAVACDERVASFGALNARANQLAWYLRTLGVRPDARVAVCLERDVDLIVSLLATLKAGGAYVPLDPAYPMDRLRFMLADSGSVVVLTQERFARRVADLGAGVPIVDVSAPSPPWCDQPTRNPDRAGVGLTSQHLAYVIHTSGSTGTPKGVMVSHASLSNFLSSMRQLLEIGSDDALLAMTTVSFDIAALEIYLPLVVGARVVMSRRDIKTQGAGLTTDLRRSGATMLQATPSSWQMLLHAGWEGGRRFTAICGGEALSADLARRLVTRSGSTWNMYGPTETTVWSTAQRLVRVDDPIALGGPIANTQVYVLDRHQQPLPVGVTGELYIGGAGAARGYLNRPALTAERFVANPFAGEGGARLYRTGDLGRWLPDGTIEFQGRNDFQVKLRGVRVELGEIEARLRACEAAVRDAVVVAREETRGDTRLVAYYTDGGTDADAVSAETLHRHMAATLPSQMVPAAYVRLASLPLTPTGKVDRKALPSFDGTASRTTRYSAPVGDVETAMARVWAEVLKVARVGRDDNFFELGGHSLLTLRLIDLLAEAGISVAIAELFAHPTIASLAARVESTPCIGASTS